MSEKQGPEDAQGTSQIEETAAGAGATGSVSQSRQTGTGAQASTQSDHIADINAPEAYAVNMKRLVANELDFDQRIRAEVLDYDQRARALSERLLRNGENHDDFRQGLANQALANAVALANRVNMNSAENDNLLAKSALSERERTVRHSDLAIDRQWNIDEVSMAAISAAIAQGVSAALVGVFGGATEEGQ
jgi:hypothetical protein